MMELFANRGTPTRPSRYPAATSWECGQDRPSELWVCCEHRILCGDARSPAGSDRLMGDARARMVFADVPYNVRIAHVQGRGQIKHPEFAYASGEMSTPQYIAFLKEGLGNAARVSIDGAVHYVCSDWRRISDVIAVGRTVYGAMLNICVWAKPTPGKARSTARSMSSSRSSGSVQTAIKTISS